MVALLLVGSRDEVARDGEVGVEFERAAELFEGLFVAAREVLERADGGADDERDGIEFLRARKLGERLVEARVGREEHAVHVARVRVFGREFDGAQELAPGARPVPVVAVAHERERDVSLCERGVGFEFTRLPEGIWMPSRSWFDSRGRESFFWKTAARRALTYADFKRFRTSSEGEKLNPPSPPPQ